MANQTSKNVLVAVRRESTTGVNATVTGAVRVRLVDSPGLELTRAQIRSGEIRTDGFQNMGRLGAKGVSGSYNTEFTAGGFVDLALESLLRSAYATATAIGYATMTSVTVGSNTVVANGGDWVGAQGIRVGDVFTITGSGTAANNGVPAPVVAVTSLTITTVTGTFVTATAAASTGTITRLKKLIAGATPTRYSHSVEQYDQDTDLSELFLGCRITGLQLSGKPGAPVTAQWTMVGMDRTALATGTSPYFTSPALTTTLPLIADDSTIRYNGATITSLTGFDLNIQLAANAQPVIGSLVPVDVFDEDTAITGSVTGLRSDFSNLTLFDAETEFELFLVFKEPGASPNAMSIFLPRVKIEKLSAPVGGSGGAKIETRSLMVGPKTAVTGYDGTPFVICSTAA